jgi:hypothetical protein
MNSYGIKGPLIKWFDNYLYQRKQKVINRATSSTVCEVSAGDPQGSVLGPLCYGFLFHSEFFFRTTRELEYSFILSRIARIFFSRIQQ